MIAWLLLGCPGETEGAPCEVAGEPVMEVAPANIQFGAFVAGDSLYYGYPPQGGALYSPFHARVTGVGNLDEGAIITIAGTDPTDGTVIAETEYEMRLLCANVEDNAGQWLGSDLHLRFGDQTYEGLDGLPLALTLSIENLDGDSVTASLEGILAALPLTDGG